VRKRGAHGASVYRARPDGPAERADVPGFPIEVVNVLGAGDAFAAGFIYGYLDGWEPARAARLGNAAGALVATRHGCSASMPTLDELSALIAEHEAAATA
jgi:5-dehydro-2-deoxygluconokinase